MFFLTGVCSVLTCTLPPLQQKAAQAALNQFKEDQDSWLMVDQILSEATYPQTKFLALQVLDNVIMTRWKVIPRDQCQGLWNLHLCVGRFDAMLTFVR